MSQAGGQGGRTPPQIFGPAPYCSPPRFSDLETCLLNINLEENREQELGGQYEQLPTQILVEWRHKKHRIAYFVIIVCSPTFWLLPTSLTDFWGTTYFRCAKDEKNICWFWLPVLKNFHPKLDVFSIYVYNYCGPGKKRNKTINLLFFVLTTSVYYCRNSPMPCSVCLTRTWTQF